jgi:uncharacterized cupredoxin-like copper-binding protein
MMMPGLASRSARLAAMLAVPVLAFTGSTTRADDTVDVALIDQGMDSMKMELSAPQVKAGKVTFNVTNKSQNLVHEFVVLKSATPVEALPYNTDEKEVDESAIEVTNEIEDIDPGKSGTLTVQLTPGTYILLCNKTGHFKAGMVHTLAVMP